MIKNTKLYLVSLGVGILIPACLFVLLLFLRALFREGQIADFMIWVFFWPAFLLARLFPGLSASAVVLLSLALVLLVSIAFFSLVTYWTLRAFQRLRRNSQTEVPPQPHLFNLHHNTTEPSAVAPGNIQVERLPWMLPGATALGSVVLELRTVQRFSRNILFLISTTFLALQNRAR